MHIICNSFRLLIFQILQQAALFNYVFYEFRERLGLEALTCSFVGNDTCLRIDVHDIACVDRSARFRAFQYRETYIDGIAVEDTRETGSYDARYAARLYCDRGVLSR